MAPARTTGFQGQQAPVYRAPATTAMPFLIICRESWYWSASPVPQVAADPHARVSSYGQEAQDAVNAIWSAHNGFFVDYTIGVANDDQAMMEQAVTNLTTIYVPEFAAFLAGATGLPEETLAELITHHVLTTKAVVDAQGSGDCLGYETVR